MGIFIVIVFLALSSWVLVALFQRLRRQHVTAGRWLAFGVLVACGIAVGISDVGSSVHERYHHYGTRHTAGLVGIVATAQT